jgi:hypothetical protein
MFHDGAQHTHMWHVPDRPLVYLQNHQCANSDRKIAPNCVECPLCFATLPVDAHCDAGLLLSQHIDARCKTADDVQLDRLRKSTRCSFRNCKVSEFTPIICKMCKANFCLKYVARVIKHNQAQPTPDIGCRHRLEVDHNCGKEPKKPVTAPTTAKTTQAKKPQAALTHEQARALQQKQLEEARKAQHQKYQQRQQSTTTTTTTGAGRPAAEDDSICIIL